MHLTPREHERLLPAAAGDLVDGGAGVGPRPPWRLDLPAGEALLLRAGQEREVTVIVGPGAAAALPSGVRYLPLSR